MALPRVRCIPLLCVSCATRIYDLTTWVPCREWIAPRRASGPPSLRNAVSYFLFNRFSHYYFMNNTCYSNSNYCKLCITAMYPSDVHRDSSRDFNNGLLYRWNSFNDSDRSGLCHRNRIPEEKKKYETRRWQWGEVNHVTKNRVYIYTFCTFHAVVFHLAVFKIYIHY